MSVSRNNNALHVGMHHIIHPFQSPFSIIMLFMRWERRLKMQQEKKKRREQMDAGIGVHGAVVGTILMWWSVMMNQKRKKWFFNKQQRHNTYTPKRNMMISRSERETTDPKYSKGFNSMWCASSWSWCKCNGSRNTKLHKSALLYYYYCCSFCHYLTLRDIDVAALILFLSSAL